MALLRVVLKDWNRQAYGPAQVRNQIPEGILSDESKNLTLTDLGYLKRRPGSARYDQSGHPASKNAENMAMWEQVSPAVVALSIDGTVYTMNLSTQAITSRHAGTAAKIWHFEPMQNASGSDHLWFCNGVDTAKKMDTSFTVTTWTNAPANIAIARVWKNRMLATPGYLGSGTTRNRIYFSAINDPETWGASDFIDVESSGTGQEAIGWIEVLEDALVVFTRNTTWMVTGEVPNLIVQKLGNPGCVGRFQAAVVDDEVWFLSPKGLYKFSYGEPPTLVDRAWAKYVSIPGSTAAYESGVRLIPLSGGKIIFGDSSDYYEVNTLVKIPLDGEEGGRVTHPIFKQENRRRSSGLIVDQPSLNVPIDIFSDNGDQGKILVEVEGSASQSNGTFSPLVTMRLPTPYSSEAPTLKPRLRKVIVETLLGADATQEEGATIQWSLKLFQDVDSSVLLFNGTALQMHGKVLFRPEIKAHPLFMQLAPGSPAGSNWGIKTITLEYRGEKEAET